jgi:DNA-binding SARP family transcriptional activator
MLHLRTFGGALVESDAAPPGPAAGQRRVLALLSIIACGGAKGVTRDAILALLWPDSDPEKARQALNQSLYHTKRALQVEELFLKGTDLRFDPEIVRADVSEFERLLDAGDLEAAVALYSGPFLDGFFVNGAPEFERWCASHRTRLAERCAQALDRIAATADAAGNTGAAADARRRLATIDPLNTRVAMDLVATLAAHGDRAGALQYARVHAELLRQEIGLEPDPALARLVERIREEPRPARHVAPPPPTGEASLPDAHATPADVAAAGAEPQGHAPFPTEPPVAAPAPIRRTRRRVAVLIGAVAGVAILAAWIALRFPSRDTAPVSGRVVVAPFRVSSADRSLAYLREGMVELLSTKLASEDPSHSTDPGSVLGAWRRAGVSDTAPSDRGLVLSVARGLGAERLLTGSVVGGPARVVLNATLLDVADGVQRAQASVEGSPDSLLVLVDRLAARLLADESLAADRLADQTTTSLAALRAYLDGQREYRSGQIQAAVKHYRFAVDRDSTFALAALGLVQAAERAIDEPLRARALALAWASRDALGERERLHLLALAGPGYPGMSTDRELLVAWEHAATALPDRADVWQGLGQQLYHAGRRLEIPDARARALTAFERARELDPSFAPPLPYLVLTAAQAGQADRAQEFADAYLALGGEVELRHFVRWYVARATRDTVALAAVRAELPRATVASLRAIGVVSLDDPWPLEDATHGIAGRLARTVRSRDRGELLRGRHALALNAGWPSEARAALEELSAMRDEQQTATIEVQPIFDALYGDGDTVFAARAVARLATRDAPGPLARCALGQWHASRRELALAREQARAMKAQGMTGATSAALCAELLEAWASVEEGQPAARWLVDRLDSLSLAGPPVGELRPYGGIALARLHVRLGAPERALAAVRRRPYFRGWQAYLSTYLRTEAMLAEQLGDRSAAARAWRHYLALRARPEATLAADAASARAAFTRVSQDGP